MKPIKVSELIEQLKTLGLDTMVELPWIKISNEPTATPVGVWIDNDLAISPYTPPYPTIH